MGGNDFALMDNNVTTAHLKNLVIDKPAPITTKLAQQKSKGNDFALMDNNVTTAHLKNLVIDKPAPITTKLAQVQATTSLSWITTSPLVISRTLSLTNLHQSL